jgi:uncharacterized protein YegP (UPF0339 family)
MAGKFEIQKSASGSFRFNLKSGNQETILSSETYQTKEEARKGAESVKSNAADDSRYDRKTSTGGQAYFVLKAANQEIIGTSETYSSQLAMENGIQAVKTTAPSAEIVDATGV